MSLSAYMHLVIRTMGRVLYVPGTVQIQLILGISGAKIDEEYLLTVLSL